MPTKTLLPASWHPSTKDSVTPRENLHRMLRGEKPLWLPIEMGCTPPVHELIKEMTGGMDSSKAFSLDWRWVWLDTSDTPEQWGAAYQKLGVKLPPTAEVGKMGLTWFSHDPKTLGKAWHLRQQFHALDVIESIEELESLPWPDCSAFANEAHVRQNIKDLHAAGYPACGALQCTIFELAWYLRGMDNLFGDLIDGNGIGDWLLDWFTDRSIQACRTLTGAGVDVISLGDDVGTQRGMMMSVDFWREHFKPRLKRVIDSIRETQGDRTVYVDYHSDGDIQPIIEDLIELGVNILNPIQPECMPVADVIRRYKDRLAFRGMIGTQTTMPFGTPGDVRAAVALCETLAREGARIIVAPTHVLEPDVPWENIVALVEATRAVRL